MAKRGRKPGTPKTGGRQKGTPNKANADLRALAQQYTGEAVDTLASIMHKSESDAARVAAVRELLERGHGKVTQPVSGDNDGGPIRVIVATGIDRAPHAA